MNDNIMCFLGICLGLLCLALAGAVLTQTITGIQPTKNIELEIK